MEGQVRWDGGVGGQAAEDAGGREHRLTELLAVALLDNAILKDLLGWKGCRPHMADGSLWSRVMGRLIGVGGTIAGVIGTSFETLCNGGMRRTSGDPDRGVQRNAAAAASYSACATGD